MIRWNLHVRALVVGLVLALVFSVLSARLVHIQVGRHEMWYEMALNNHVRKIPIEARRGNILDVNGEVLATSLPLQRVAIDPDGLRESFEKTVRRATARAAKNASVKVPTVRELEDQLVAELAPLLQQRPEEIREKITRSGRYVELARRVGPETVVQIRALKRPQITFDEDFQRIYPNGSLASHVIGYVDYSQVAGKQGVEERFQKFLQGRDGWRRIVRDPSGREIVPYRAQDVRPINGYNLYLTIDSTIQHIVEQELDRAVQEFSPVGAVAIVTRPRTGEILAMASRPTYDPNQRKTDIDALRNRAISDIVEPGSTFKIVTTTAGLNEGLINLDSRFDCEQGTFYFAGYSLKDHEPHGVLTVREGIEVSSNIMAAKIAIQMGEARLYEYVRRFGFGEKTLIPLPAEQRGILYPTNRWSKISITRIPMGHEIACTPLQVIMAFGAIANGGLLMRPLIVKKIADADGNTVSVAAPTTVRRVVSPRAASMMTEALQSVVSEQGTAIKASVEGFSVAGKTGTAEKINPATGTYYRGRQGKVVASFVGYLPAANPEFCVLVVLDEPEGRSTYGGQTAAPVFSRISTQVVKYLGLQPDRPVGPNLNMAENLAR